MIDAGRSSADATVIAKTAARCRTRALQAQPDLRMGRVSGFGNARIGSRRCTKGWAGCGCGAPSPLRPPSARSGPAGAFPEAKDESAHRNHVDRPRPWHQAEGGHPAFEAGEPGRIRISSMTGITAARSRVPGSLHAADAAIGRRTSSQSRASELTQPSLVALDRPSPRPDAGDIQSCCARHGSEHSASAFRRNAKRQF